MNAPRAEGRPVSARSVYIAVVGAREASPEELRWAESVGREVARAGAVLVCGGRGGAMEAASRGAQEAGGLVLGILPEEDRFSANPYVSVAVATGMGSARNVIIVRTADAVVAVGGGFGTLSEIALALGAGKPVIGLGTWRLSRAPARVSVGSGGAGPGAGGPGASGIIEADSPESAVRLALEALGARTADGERSGTAPRPGGGGTR